MLVVALISLMVVACGSANQAGDDADDTKARTLDIARVFAIDGNTEAARAALQELPVANDEQWLLLVTENALTDGTMDTGTRNALVNLALGLGLSEATLITYAESNGLITAQANNQAATGAAGAAGANAAVADLPVVSDAAAAPNLDLVAALPVAETANANTSALAGAAQAAPPSPAAPAEPAATPTTAPTPTAAPLTAATTQVINLRTGPGTTYSLAGTLNPGEQPVIVARNPAGDWYQLNMSNGATEWVFAQLVTASGPTDGLPVATDIPPAPTAAPVAAAPAAPAAPPPAAEPTAAPAPPAPNPSDTPTFTLAQRRMWSKEENGGCAGQHLLRIIVLDAAGNPLNGVTLRGVYTGIELTTGSQGKGDGRIEFDLYGTGEAFKVARNDDGREVVSDEAGGFTTKSLEIDIPTLIGGGYCSSDADCQVFYNSFGCTGHHSWEGIFKRNY